MGEEKRNVPIEQRPRIKVDTYGGNVHVEWDPTGAVTALGQLPFFIHFLKTGNLFDPWVRDCPLAYTSPNAPHKRDVNGTLLLSILSGHKRYAHITSIRMDGVNPELLGMKKVLSEDAIRRALEKIPEEKGVSWLQKHIGCSYGPLLSEPWILDVDTTVKPLYGNQEGAEIGYNPEKRGRPSHTYHTYMLANLRLVLDVEVQPGKQIGSKYSLPGLWQLLDRIPRRHWPAFVRGDCAWGTEGVMCEAEEKGVGYLFKLRSTNRVKRLVEQMMRRSDWENAGDGWEGIESELMLSGWTRKRRIIVMRRRIHGGIALVEKTEAGQQRLAFIETADENGRYEYAVLITSLEDELLTLGEHYRDRADAENNFDELKNQWGWGGYTTKDLKRCRLMARMVGLVYNWWNLFVRLANGKKHHEAITSRPLLLEGVGKVTRHAGQTRITITSMHGKMKQAQAAMVRLTRFLNKLRTTAEQLSAYERWCCILSMAFVKYLKGKVLRPPVLLPQYAV